MPMRSVADLTGVSVCVRLWLNNRTHSIPVVAPHVGGFPEVVEHGKTGWLVKNRNADEFVQIINDVLSNNGTMATAGENARERAQKYFSIECMRESYMNMYMDIVR